ncbi:MAG: hypothetical protein LBI05_09395 [Planctomycetaceae bacterium]|jgi:hypothetical protein|nr:hypothetical protein [Planctomycetaceae bacterium]
MEGTIITLIFAIIMIVAHILKAIRESAEAAKQQQNPDPEDEELVLISRPNPVRQTKPMKPMKANKQRLTDRQPLDSFDAPKRQALSRKLSPQGEGERFEADPGTLDPSRIVAPTIDPTVKPELESITGIYEEGALFADRSQPAIALNLADYLAKPEGIIHAVIFAEILNRPAWLVTREK